MPLQNRVKPDGEIVASPSRGTLTGNRGVIHRNKKIVKQFKTKYWITCALEYKNLKRNVMTEGRWTELFFLDEATAFAAGHRPCGFCRNKEYKLFKELWIEANANTFGLRDFSIVNIDRILHEERISHDGHKLTHKAKLGTLPDGTMVQLTNDPNFYLWFNRRLLKWSEFGYLDSADADPTMMVIVLTPKSVVEVFKLGYESSIHHTAKNF